MSVCGGCVCKGGVQGGVLCKRVSVCEGWVCKGRAVGVSVTQGVM